MNKLLISFLIVFMVILLPQNSLKVNAANEDAITISMRNNALNAAVKFLSAQKNCIVDEMIQYSINIQNVDDINEYYQSTCKEYPLQKAEVTDLVVVSSNLALVSTKLDYEDRVVVQTSPVIKNDNKWRIVKGINQGLASATEKIKPEILEGIHGYFNSIKTGDKAGFEKNGKYLGKDERNLERFLNDKSIDLFEYKAKRMKMISETVAVVTIETTINQQSKEKKYVIFKENDQWKVIADMFLLTTSIPKTANPVKVK